tara:strand:+ start:760 stop:2826 length:2067 start_codon:yes stop_codon:yes gene_type:complete
MANINQKKLTPEEIARRKEELRSKMTTSVSSGVAAPQSDAESTISANPYRLEGDNLIGDSIRQLTQGLTLGGADEAEGFLRGIYQGATSGKSFSDAINEGIDHVRAQNKAFEEANPRAALGLQVGGGLATGFVGGGRALAAQGAKQLSLGQRIAQGGKVGGTIGATTGALTSEGGFDQEGLMRRATGALEGGAIGAGLGAAFPVATSGAYLAGKTAGRFIPGGSQRQTENLMRNVGAADRLPARGHQLGPKEIGPTKSPAVALKSELDEIGPEAVVADVGQENVRDLARYTANKFGGREAEGMLAERMANQGLRIEDTVLGSISNKSLPDFLEETEKARRIAARQNYGELYEMPVSLTPKLKTFFDNKHVQRAWKGAKEIAEVDDIILTPLVTKTVFKTGDAPIKQYLNPTLEHLDFLKQGLDDLVTRANNAGNFKLSGRLKQKRNDFRDYVDELTDGKYAKVRSEYAGSIAAEEAAILGSNFAKNVTSVSVNQLKKLGEHERESFKVGFADNIVNKVLGTPDQADAVKKIFGNHLARRRLREALGGQDGALEALEERLKAEIAMEKTSAIRFNSRTTPMAEQATTFGASQGILGDVVSAAAGHPLSGARLGGRLFDKVATRPEAVAARLQRLLFSQNPKDQEMAIALLTQGQTLGSRSGGMAHALFTPASSFYAANPDISIDRALGK